MHQNGSAWIWARERVRVMQARQTPPRSIGWARVARRFVATPLLHRFDPPPCPRRRPRRRNASARSCRVSPPRPTQAHRRRDPRVVPPGSHGHFGKRTALRSFVPLAFHEPFPKPSFARPRSRRRPCPPYLRPSLRAPHSPTDWRGAFRGPETGATARPGGSGLAPSWHHRGVLPFRPVRDAPQPQPRPSQIHYAVPCGSARHRRQRHRRKDIHCSTAPRPATRSRAFRAVGCVARFVQGARLSRP